MTIGLIAVDFSDLTERLIETVRQLHGAADTRWLLLHVIAPEPDFVTYEPGPQYIRDEVAKTIRTEHHELDALADRLRAEGIDARPLLVQGSTAEKIIEKAAHFQVDWIALGTHGHGALYHLVLGSVSEAVLKSATCPVMLVPRHKD